MTEPKTGLASLELKDAVRLRCTLHDIKSRRSEIVSVSPDDRRILIDLGLVEMQGDVSVSEQTLSSSGPNGWRERRPGANPLIHLRRVLDLIEPALEDLALGGRKRFAEEVLQPLSFARQPLSECRGGGFDRW
jgi:hypothetical protein